MTELPEYRPNSIHALSRHTRDRKPIKEGEGATLSCDIHIFRHRQAQPVPNQSGDAWTSSPYATHGNDNNMRDTMSCQ